MSLNSSFNSETGNSETGNSETGSRLKLVAAIMIVCLALGGGYILYASQRAKQTIADQTLPQEELTSLETILGETQNQSNQPGEQSIWQPDRVETQMAAESGQTITKTEMLFVKEPVVSKTTDFSPTTDQLPQEAPVDEAPDPTVAPERLVFVNRSGGEEYGRLAVAEALQPDQRALTDLRCARVHMANGTGICLQTPAEAQGSEGQIILFDGQFQVTKRFFLYGNPSRTRVSADGTKAAYTILVTGHSYTVGTAAFSTDTRIVDLQADTRKSLEDDFKAYRDGERFHHFDFNYWGITFANDSNRFYATLSSQGQTYIVEGDLQALTVRVITENGECPSLSPDNRSLVFKERQGGLFGPPHFQLVRYDLETGERTPLSEERSVDDQVEWLDADTIIYALPGDVPSTRMGQQLWTLDISPGSTPHLYLSNAESPALVRGLSK